MQGIILRQHNDLIDLPLRTLNPNEIDLFMALCYKAQGSGAEKITISFGEIKRLMGCKRCDRKRFLNLLDATSRKLRKLEFRTYKGNVYVDFVLFPEFETNPEKGTLAISVSKTFEYLLNNLNKNYTQLELEECTGLRTSYSKLMYRQLRKFAGTGRWITTIENLRTFLDITDKYSAAQISNKIIEPALKELSVYFENLGYEKYYENSSGVGRPKVAGYVFTFKAKKTAGTLLKKAFECPKCGRAVYEIPKKDGTVYYSHTYEQFEDYSCDATFSTFAEGKGLDENPGRDRRTASDSTSEDVGSVVKNTAKAVERRKAAIEEQEKREKDIADKKAAILKMRQNELNPSLSGLSGKERFYKIRELKNSGEYND